MNAVQKRIEFLMSKILNGVSRLSLIMAVAGGYGMYWGDGARMAGTGADSRVLG